MLSTLLVGLALGTASVVTTAASPIDLTTRDDGITCMSSGSPFAASYDDCVNDFDRLYDNGGIAVDIGKKGHHDWLTTDTVQVHLDETWDDSCKGQVLWGEVATLMGKVMNACRGGSPTGGHVWGEAVLRQKGNCGSTLFVGKNFNN